MLVTAFATADGIALLEPAMRDCLLRGGQGTLILALDRQHFNAADVFERLANLVKSFPERLEVRIVHERAGLLHAKAVFAKLPDGTATLLVGSANLTERAFNQNHELGLWVNLLGEPEVSRAFQLFAQRLGGVRLDEAGLRRLAAELGSIPRVIHPPGIQPEPSRKSFEELFGPESSTTGTRVEINTFVGDWLQAGSIVGRGRRGLDVLVIQTPADRLERLGLIRPKAAKRIEDATDRTYSAGYGLRLLPDTEDERLRMDARRTQRILSKLTLNLPCFGLWMPNAYWDLFQQALAQVRADGMPSELIRAAAERRHGELAGPGLGRQVDAIVADLKEHDALVTPHRDGELRTVLLDHFNVQLSERTPDLIARAVGFRTQRQSLASGLDLGVVARSFFVDLVQSTFAATYRTGAWPRRFRSFVGRALSDRIAKRMATDERPIDKLALLLLDGAARWEDDRVELELVTAEVNRVLGEAGDLPTLTVEDLLRAEQEGGSGDADDD